jgi:hypothetical protein
VHTLDTPDHAGGWSVDAPMTLPAWGRQGLEMDQSADTTGDPWD